MESKIKNKLNFEIDSSTDLNFVKDGVLYRRKPLSIFDDPHDLPLRIDFPLKKLPKKIYAEYKDWCKFDTPTNFPVKDAQLLHKLFLCGTWRQTDFHCKGCIDNGISAPMKKTYSQIFCESRYCLNPACMVDRFAINSQTFDSIKRLDGLRSLWHFVISFEHISLDEFRNNWTFHKKKFEAVVNKFWSHLKKAGIEIPAIRVWDFSFEKEGFVLPHFHYGAIPPKSSDRRDLMIRLNEVKKKLCNRSQSKINFIFKSFGYKKKGAILAYLAKRSAGIYKHGEGKNLDWNTGTGRLRKDIEAGKYFGLQDFLTVKQYLKHFHGRRHYSSVGGLPRGSKPTDNIESEKPDYCPICQKDLTFSDVLCRHYMNVTPPPNYLKNSK